MRVEQTTNQISPAFIREESVNQVQQQQQQGSSQSAKTEKSDKLSISQAANSINEVAAQIKTTEQFRADKVSQIKAQIESNSYDPKSRDVAEKMIAQIGSFLKGVSA
jgi:flagellar biosynthesis anti-sigma factor FlgM